MFHLCHRKNKYCFSTAFTKGRPKRTSIRTLQRAQILSNITVWEPNNIRAFRHNRGKRQTDHQLHRKSDQESNNRSFNMKQLNVTFAMKSGNFYLLQHKTVKPPSSLSVRVFHLGVSTRVSRALCEHTLPASPWWADGTLETSERGLQRISGLLGSGSDADAQRPPWSCPTGSSWSPSSTGNSRQSGLSAELKSWAAAAASGRPPSSPGCRLSPAWCSGPAGGTPSPAWIWAARCSCWCDLCASFPPRVFSTVEERDVRLVVCFVLIFFFFFLTSQRSQKYLLCVSPCWKVWSSQSCKSEPFFQMERCFSEESELLVLGMRVVLLYL